MASVLFLGNSHLSAYRLSYDETKGPNIPECRFFCARGADLAFTEASSGRIRPVLQVEVGEEEIKFAGLPAAWTELYCVQKRPIADVRSQFINTGGEGEIDLRNVALVFYVVGISPYDFIRLREYAAPISRSLRRQLLGCMLDEKFLMHHQIEGIRRFNPDCKHFFIGMPLSAGSYPLQTETERLILVEKRNVIRSMARDFLFDDVFMPSAELLDESLLSTKAIYTRGGREEAEVFQKGMPTQSDNSHMNREYGKRVFREFIEPQLRSLTMAAIESALPLAAH